MTLSLRARVPERGVSLDLEVPTGQTLALIGPNGAGKSTLLSLIAGTLRPPSGEVHLDGQVLTAPGRWVRPHDRRITTLSQDAVLFPHLTARGNIRFALRSQGASRARARTESERWLVELGLEPLARRRPSQLSGGQAQRVAIARALAAEPRLLLLDEPMPALDIDVASALREMLRRSLAERTAVIVTHDVLDALTLADRIVVLESGRILEDGPTAEVLRRPRSDFAARFAGLNLLTGCWDDRGLRLADGAVLPASPPPGTSPGEVLHAAFRPSAVRLSAQAGVERTVTALSPRGDLVRLSTRDLAADLPPDELAGHGIMPGSRVHLDVPPEAVTLYPGARSPYDGAP